MADLAIQFVVYLAPGHRHSWAESPLVAQARTFSQSDVVLDPDGDLALKFQISTSGHVVLYDREGLLRFSGGITCGRGHEGENPGSNALQAAFNRPGKSAGNFPVYGCPIHSRERLTHDG